MKAGLVMHHLKTAGCCSQSHSVAACFSLLCNVQVATSLHLPVQRRRNEVAVCRVPHWWPRRWLCLVYFLQIKIRPCPSWFWKRTNMYMSSLICICHPHILMCVCHPWQYVATGYAFLWHSLTLCEYLCLFVILDNLRKQAHVRLYTWTIIHIHHTHTHAHGETHALADSTQKIQTSSQTSSVLRTPVDL